MGAPVQVIRYCYAEMFMTATPCLHRNGKKTAWVALAVSGEDNLSICDLTFFFFSRGSVFANRLMIKKYHWNTAFYASNFQDFQNFPGRCPEPRLGGLQRPPTPPAGLRGASRPAALCAACTLFSKNLSQTTLGAWPATPLPNDNNQVLGQKLNLI